MAYYKILYWQKIPAQFKVWDDFNEIKIELSEKFIAKIDQSAKEQNLIATEEYLNQWNWSEEAELEGTVEEITKALKEELEKSI